MIVNTSFQNTLSSIVDRKIVTVSDLCSFIFNDIKKFQDIIENEKISFYEDEMKLHYLKTDNKEQSTEEWSNKIYDLIERETIDFVNSYYKEALDLTIDFYNRKKIKKIQYQNILIVLTSLKEQYDK